MLRKLNCNTMANVNIIAGKMLIVLMLMVTMVALHTWELSIQFY